jgi:hypothetical protein
MPVKKKTASNFEFYSKRIRNKSFESLSREKKSNSFSTGKKWNFMRHFCFVLIWYFIFNK